MGGGECVVCDIYCKIIFYWFLFGGFAIASLIPLLYEMSGGEMKELNSDQLRALYFDYIEYRDNLTLLASRVSVLEYYNANKGKYENT